MAERVARQVTIERTVAHQKRRKKKVGDRPEAELHVMATIAPTGRQEALVPMSTMAAAVVSGSQPSVETVGSSDGPIPGASS